MKKLIALLMVLVMVCGFAAISSAEEGDYDVTRAITAYFDEKDFLYSYDGFSSSGREVISFSYKYNTGLTEKITLFIDESGATVGLKMWNYMNIDPEDLAEVTAICNTLNKNTVFAKFYTDDSDNTVNITLDIVVMNAPNSGEIVYEAIDWILTAAKDVYPQLEAYAR